MGDAADEGVLQYVGEGGMSDVVHEDSRLYRFCLTVEDEYAFLLQGNECLAHEVECS